MAIFGQNAKGMSTLLQKIAEHRVSALVILMAGLALRLINLTEGGLWLDEIWSMQISASSGSVGAIVAACIADTHPPLFDILLHYWLVLVGDTDLGGRSFGLLWGIAGMALTWYYALRISGNRGVAFVALAILSFNYFHIYYSNEVRFYSFIYLLSLVITAHLYLYLKASRKLHLIISSVVLVALLYTHYYGVFIMAALATAVFLLTVFSKIPPRLFWNYVLASVLVTVAFAPWIPVLLSGTASESWMQPPALWHFLEYFYAYTGKNPVTFIFIVGMLSWGVRCFNRHPVLLTILYSAMIVGFLLPFLASHLVVPMLHERYTMIYLPAIVLATAVVFMEIPRLNWTRRGLVLIVLWVSIGLNFASFHSYFLEREKEPWKAIAEDLFEANGSLQAPVHTEMHFWLNYYLNQSNQPPALANTDSLNAPLFWRLITPYDQEQAVSAGHGEFLVAEQRSYRNGFELLLLRQPD